MSNRRTEITDTLTYTIETYLDDGRVFEYEVVGAGKAREHSAAIVSTGYRHNDGGNVFEHYPPHRILKVKVEGTDPVPTKYPDRVRGT